MVAHGTDNQRDGLETEAEVPITSVLRPDMLYFETL